MRTALKGTTLLLVAGSIAWLTGCSDLKKDLPATAPATAQIHPKEWNDTSASGFHGNVLAANGFNTDACRQCHGGDYGGGTSGVACRTCHNSYPHGVSWLDSTSVLYHGAYLKARSYNSAECQACHGTRLDGGSSQVSCKTCHAGYPHPVGWNTDTTSTDFHGTYLRVMKNYDMTECQQCHGQQYNGGTSGKSCKTCHANFPHPQGWTTTSDANFHGQYLSAKSFDATECEVCHGTDYSGGRTGVSCRTCHSSFPHAAGWQDSTSAQFHGTYLGTKSYSTTECQPCHGQQYDGGSSGVSCKTCHSTFPHPQGWNTSSDPLFHGVYLKANSYTMTACQPCHGTNYDGGRTGVSCRTCHTTFPHTAGWVTSSAADFHGVYLKSNGYNLSECQNCHGAQYTGGTSGVSCFTCHSSFPHAQGWTTESSGSFHGKYLEAKSYAATECQACHGTQYDGGTSGISCKTCHASFPHPTGWVGSGATSHIAFIKSINFALSSCRVCHGQNYGTVKVDNSCLTCHTQTGGPEACNTCHGSATNPAPPVDLDGNSATTFRGVGAHQAHLASGTLGALVQCAECHTVPATLDAAGHLGSDVRAEVMFNDTLARLPSRDGELVPNPSYDYATFTCSNTYCHGNWVLRKATSSSQFEYADSIMVGANASVVWTGGSSEAACGSCHGLPPTGHAAATLATCQNCHGGVVDGTGAIIDQTKHINGVINVFNTERPIR